MQGYTEGCAATAVIEVVVSLNVGALVLMVGLAQADMAAATQITIVSLIKIPKKPSECDHS